MRLRRFLRLRRKLMTQRKLSCNVSYFRKKRHHQQTVGEIIKELEFNTYKNEWDLTDYSQKQIKVSYMKSENLLVDIENYKRDIQILNYLLTEKSILCHNKEKELRQKCKDLHQTKMERNYLVTLLEDLKLARDRKNHLSTYDNRLTVTLDFMEKQLQELSLTKEKEMEKIVVVKDREIKEIMAKNIELREHLLEQEEKLQNLMVKNAKLQESLKYQENYCVNVLEPEKKKLESELIAMNEKFLHRNNQMSVMLEFYNKFNRDCPDVIRNDKVFNKLKEKYRGSKNMLKHYINRISELESKINDMISMFQEISDKKDFWKEQAKSLKQIIHMEHNKVGFLRKQLRKMNGMQECTRLENSDDDSDCESFYEYDNAIEEGCIVNTDNEDSPSLNDNGKSNKLLVPNSKPQKVPVKFTFIRP